MGFFCVSILNFDFGVRHLMVHDKMTICGFQTIRVSSKDQGSIENLSHFSPLTLPICKQLVTEFVKL